MDQIDKQYVVVTTAHRGVFGGYLDSNDGEQVTLIDASMCLQWTADVKGVLGLAVTGPSRSSRVGPAVPRLVLSGVTAVMDATDEARDAWLAQPW